MFIKQIILQGFKSYGLKTVVEAFDTKHNVVVGRNGSGKSNFFMAIQFVLSDEFTHLQKAQREALLHESTGPRIISAYVEIIFDNGDSRIPIEQNEVAIRRVIGPKKDQYFLNRKVTPRSEIENLLGACGFSMHNPYYIIKQGNVHQIATATDSYRLKLLNEVAGVTMYDEKQTVAVEILNETEEKLKRISEFISNIVENLQALEQEKEEYKEYEKQDKIRRALKYYIHNAELVDLRQKLSTLVTERNEIVNNQASVESGSEEIKSRIAKFSKANRETKNKLKTLEDDRESKSNDFQLLTKRKAELKYTIDDLGEEINGEIRSKEKAEQQLTELTKVLDERNIELLEVQSTFRECKKKEDELRKELNIKEHKRKALYAKQAHGQQFRSKNDRDVWIKKELMSLKEHSKNKVAHEEKLTEDLKQDEMKRSELVETLERLTEAERQERNAINEYGRKRFALKRNSTELNAQKTALWKKENDLQQRISALTQEANKAELQLNKSAGKATSNGKKSVQKVLNSFLEKEGADLNVLRSYHGLVIDRFTCDKDLYTPVEVTAGNRLFNHIVDTDVVGTKILKEINRQQLPGEVVFMPVNRLCARNVEYPQTESCVPIISRLRYDETFELPMSKVFGDTLLCADIDVATKAARQCKMNCVTLTGDRVAAKGFLTGGHYRNDRSVLQRHRTRCDLLDSIAESRRELAKISKEIDQVLNAITNVDGEIQNAEFQCNKSKTKHDKLRSDIKLAREELNNIERAKVSKETCLARYSGNIETMQIAMDELEAELNQSFLSHLSEVDENSLKILLVDIKNLEKETKKAFNARIQLEPKMNKLENLLTNLRLKKDELLSVIEEASLDSRELTLLNAVTEHGDIEKKLSELTAEINILEMQIKDINEKLKGESSELENLNKRLNEVEEEFNERAKYLDKISLDQTSLEQKIAECLEETENLGPLPHDKICEKYQNMPKRLLNKELAKNKVEMKKFDHVNKGVMDYITLHTNLVEKFKKKKMKLENDFDKIKDLIAVLNSYKADITLFTFRQVSKYFSSVFKKLVPEGHGKLVMVKRAVDSAEVAQDEDRELCRFSGISIKVTFAESTTEAVDIKQLSGGQKCLVALAFIFAVQECDPAPFYLFDEIDAALDREHREAVADLIHDRSSTSQFITTTFRPEMLVHANKFYGIKCRNKVSHIECVTREETKDFLEDAQMQN